MSASLIVLIPIVLLGVVTALCFVGCGLSTHGLPPDFTTYSDTTVLGNVNNVAYWRLNETADTDPAADSKGANNGGYIDPTTTPVPAFYPWPAFSIPDPPNPDELSAAGQGTLKLGQPGIVNGDFVQPANTTRATCMVVDGAFVAVPFNAAINPATFTLEAWVRVDWTSSDPLAFRAVVDCRSDNPGQGFALYAAPDSDQSGNYHWQAFVGNGGSDPTAFTTVTSNDPPIALNNPDGGGATTFYLAVTFDGQTLLIFVNGDESSKTNPATYVPNVSQPLWIGAGAPFVAQRPQPPGTVASPLFPWVGAIQDVAIYNVDLGGDVIIRHFHNGMGNDP
jgi:hypothetical protein